MMQMAGQISLFDFLSESAPLGWTKGIKMGQVIPFQNLKKYIGKRVVYATHMGNGNPVSKVVIIKNTLLTAMHTMSLKKTEKQRFTTILSVLLVARKKPRK